MIRTKDAEKIGKHTWFLSVSAWDEDRHEYVPVGGGEFASLELAVENLGAFIHADHASIEEVKWEADPIEDEEYGVILDATPTVVRQSGYCYLSDKKVWHFEWTEEVR